MAHFLEEIGVKDWATLILVVTTIAAVGKYFIGNQTHEVVDGELKRLNKSITELTQTIMKLGMQIDNIVKSQDEQSRMIDRHDKAIDDHSVRIARLEEHVKGD